MHGGDGHDLKSLTLSPKCAIKCRIEPRQRYLHYVPCTAVLQNSNVFCSSRSLHVYCAAGTTCAVCMCVHKYNLSCVHVGVRRYHLGCARTCMRNFEGAAAALEQAEACLPRHPAILHELAKAYLVGSPVIFC